LTIQIELAGLAAVRVAAVELHEPHAALDHPPRE
jgi:hypothetical protein